jgi:hypothetical protein
MPGCSPENNDAIRIAVSAEMSNTVDIPKLCANVSEYQKEYREKGAASASRHYVTSTNVRFNVPYCD